MGNICYNKIGATNNPQLLCKGTSRYVRSTSKEITYYVGQGHTSKIQTDTLENYTTHTVNPCTHNSSKITYYTDINLYTNRKLYIEIYTETQKTILFQLNDYNELLNDAPTLMSVCIDNKITSLDDITKYEILFSSSTIYFVETTKTNTPKIVYTTKEEYTNNTYKVTTYKNPDIEKCLVQIRVPKTHYIEYTVKIISQMEEGGKQPLLEKNNPRKVHYKVTTHAIVWPSKHSKLKNKYKIKKRKVWQSKNMYYVRVKNNAKRTYEYIAIPKKIIIGPR